VYRVVLGKGKRVFDSGTLPAALPVGHSVGGSDLVDGRRRLPPMVGGASNSTT
jgi:hypothetical protein